MTNSSRDSDLGFVPAELLRSGPAMRVTSKMLTSAERAVAGAGETAMSRRGFVLTSLKVGTAAGVATMLPACDGMGVPTEADGSFEAPWTSEEPGPGTAYFATVYGALVDNNRARLWVEVLDTGTGEAHEMNQTNYVKQIVLRDEFDNDIDSQGFRFDNQARLISVVELPPEVERIKAYYESSTTGWWVAYFNVSDIKAEPVGDLRRPLTVDQPGAWPDKIVVHTPLYGIRPDGKHTVEVGDRTQGELHPMTPDHYVSTILVYDRYHQLRAYAQLSPATPEPVIDFNAVGGTTYVRVVAYCNLHDWWEAVYQIST